MRTLQASACLLLPLVTSLAGAAPLRTVAEFQALAAPFHSEIVLPTFETTPAQVTASCNVHSSSLPSASQAMRTTQVPIPP